MSGEIVKVYERELEAPNRRGGPLGRWKNRLEEYLGERGISGMEVLEETRRECWDMEGWRLFCRGHHLDPRNNLA